MTRGEEKGLLLALTILFSLGWAPSSPSRVASDAQRLTHAGSVRARVAQPKSAIAAAGSHEFTAWGRPRDAPGGAAAAAAAQPAL